MSLPVTLFDGLVDEDVTYLGGAGTAAGNNQRKRRTMDARLLDDYLQELRWLRTTSVEFAR